ncbi:unnamed protein product [Polarella glacialis]|uniref:Phosphatidate phosphatase APP1 catalytic domain-containing protein n=1 Tax=Polarella glacialis TaxID=89957 RepID=A0A813ICK5_POLGL|nr:unnamed protein product [Polarella glacialis]
MVRPLDVESIFEGDDWTDISQRSIPVGLGGAALVLAVYFCWEGGPWHASRRAESASLTLVLLLIYVSCFVCGRMADLEERERAGFQMRQLMRLLLSIFILQQSVLPRVHPRYAQAILESACGGAMPEREGKKLLTRRSQDVAREVEGLIAEILTHSSGQGLATLVRAELLGPLMICLTLVAEMLTVVPAFDSQADEAIWIIELAVILAWLGVEVRSFYKMGVLAGQLHKRVVSIRDPWTLSNVLATVSAGSLLEVSTRDTRRWLLETALRDKLLCTRSKAILLFALQQLATRPRLPFWAQVAAADLLMSCHGPELTKLKNMVDASGSYFNLQRLVHVALTRRKLRSGVLQHLASEAKQSRSEGAVGIKILVDMDDTFVCSGGRFPKGCDRRFPHHMVYPGCLELLRVLDTSFRAEAPSCNLIFLSARPHIYKSVMEDKSYKLFLSLFHEGRLHTVPTLLPGLLSCGLRAMLTVACWHSRAWRKVGEAKFKTFTQFQTLYPEYDFIFLGDNGQGDLLAAQLMAEKEHQDLQLDQDMTSKPERPRFLGALIQEVMPTEFALASVPASLRGPDWHKALEDTGVIFHRSYVGAALALHARHPDIVGAKQVVSVVNAAVDDFHAGICVYGERRKGWDKARADLQNDLKKVVDSFPGSAGALKKLLCPGEVLRASEASEEVPMDKDELEPTPPAQKDESEPTPPAQQASKDESDPTPPAPKASKEEACIENSKVGHVEVEVRQDSSMNVPGILNVELQ